MAGSFFCKKATTENCAGKILRRSFASIVNDYRLSHRGSSSGLSSAYIRPVFIIVIGFVSIGFGVVFIMLLRKRPVSL